MSVGNDQAVQANINGVKFINNKSAMFLALDDVIGKNTTYVQETAATKIPSWNLFLLIVFVIIVMIVIMLIITWILIKSYKTQNLLYFV